MFADDLLLFCAAEVNSVKHLMDAFQTFSARTGLEANYTKSKIVIRGCHPKTEQDILHITRINPFRYLGVPITASRLSKIECRSMVEKMTTRIKTWASRHLSYVGRATLIHSVLLGIYTFWAKIFVLP